MVRTVKSHHEGDEDDDMEFSSRALDVKVEGRHSDQKANTLRSKHSETEQRRRSKINERFQTLRDIIPENDQKRDKASFLLEVIEYIQFLKDKIQIYEGPYQGWSPEPSKLMPWRRASGPVEIFTEQSQLIRNGSAHEDNIVVNSMLLANAHDSVESDLNGAAVYKTMDESHTVINEAIPFNMPLQPSLFDGVSVQPSHGSSSYTDQLASQAQLFDWADKQEETQSDVPIFDQNDQEELKTECGEDSLSIEYSQRVLNTLNQTLVSMGVDMSQASVSVELDVGKRTSSETSISALGGCETYDHAHKKLRREQR
ncbi:transcription factor BIM3-like isoform X2 [Ipomoea triloba]|uniref:transcription factor BIM3-like isoform X2 n=1 Tax=Ipomoea triloba TaxID=35885 RepID=UPI00125E0665|nr:transcription factor BIM3-like isoform X2 [Ipomoea triloba]XP_031109161.1 transcription factor BIM3-like isoform X2 [Ipomoea triloba]